MMAYHNENISVFSCLCVNMRMHASIQYMVQIVIISERGKEEMEDLLAKNPPRDGLQGSTISCRTGDPLIRSELIKVSAQHARCGQGCVAQDGL